MLTNVTERVYDKFEYLVPNGLGNKARGAILSRAVQYIRSLKENEAPNIEKWSFKKLLMDQAMVDLQAQPEEVKCRWKDKTMSGSRAEAELKALRNMNRINGHISNGAG